MKEKKDWRTEGGGAAVEGSLFWRSVAKCRENGDEAVSNRGESQWNDTRSNLIWCTGMGEGRGGEGGGSAVVGTGDV